MSELVKDKRLQINVTTRELEALRKLADRQTRTVSYVGREFILDGLRKAKVRP